MQQILTYAFLVIYTVTILGIVLVIITDNRNPLKTLPWIIVLVFAPVVGLVFYFFFGQNLSKQRIISRRTRKRITMQLEEALDDGRPDIPDEHLPLARLLAATIHSVPLYGSRIAAAVHRIHFRTLFNHLFHGEFFVEFASGETVDTVVFIPAVVAVRTVESGVSECHSAALANFFLHIAIYSKHRIKYINVYRR